MVFTLGRVVMGFFLRSVVKTCSPKSVELIATAPHNCDARERGTLAVTHEPFANTLLRHLVASNDKHGHSGVKEAQEVHVLQDDAQGGYEEKDGDGPDAMGAGDARTGQNGRQVHGERRRRETRGPRRRGRVRWAGRRGAARAPEGRRESQGRNRQDDERADGDRARRARRLRLNGDEGPGRDRGARSRGAGQEQEHRGDVRVTRHRHAAAPGLHDLRVGRGVDSRGARGAPAGFQGHVHRDRPRPGRGVGQRPGGLPQARATR